MRRIIINFFSAVIVVAFGVSSLALAHDGHEHGSHDQPQGTFIVTEGETINGSYYAAGNKITVEGTIDGDLYCAGQNITVTGTVKGDVLCAGQTVTIGGVVEGDARIAAQNVIYEGAIGGSASTFAQNINVSEGATINRDFNGASQLVSIEGSVGRDIFLATSQLQVFGAVGGDISGYYEQLLIESGATVAGDARYTSDVDGVIADGTVAGQVERTAPPVDDEGDSASEVIFGAAVYTFISMLAVSLAIALIAPQLVHAVSDRGIRQFLPSLLVGFFVMFATPIAALLLAITVVGIPLAGLLMLSWVIILILSGPVFGYLLGRKIMAKRTTSPLLIMLVGASILLLSYFVPIANIFTILAALIVGSGMITIELSKRYKKPAYKVKG